MSVVLTDEEFIRIYQAAHLGIHPGTEQALAFRVQRSAIDVLDAVPETDQLRAAALEAIPELGSVMDAETRALTTGSQIQPDPAPPTPLGEVSRESLVEQWEVGIFHVEAMYWGDFDSPDVTGLGVIADEDSRMMDGAIYAYPFLDGGLVLVEKESPEDWDDAALDDGIWIVGNAALRLICDTLGMDQPSRLPGEVDVPDIALIHRASEAGRIVCSDARSQAEAMQWWSEIRALVAKTPEDWIARTGQPD